MSFILSGQGAANVSTDLRAVLHSICRMTLQGDPLHPHLSEGIICRRFEVPLVRVVPRPYQAWPSYFPTEVLP